MKLRHGAQAVVRWLNLFLVCRFLAQGRLTKREKLAMLVLHMYVYDNGKLGEKGKK